MPVVTIEHRTTYDYRFPVTLGEHALMVRPIAGASVRVRNSRLRVSSPAKVHRGHDGFGNVVDRVTFDRLPVTSLTLLSAFTVEHTPRSIDDIANAMGSGGRHARDHRCPAGPDRLVPNADGWGRDGSNLHAARRVHRPDDLRSVKRWAEAVAARAHGDGLETMVAMVNAIGANFEYAKRYERGTQDPATTLAQGKGTCRDFAMLMIDAARRLGTPARFVSGYLYDDTLQELDCGRNTHAWMQAYLPAVGWVDFDPTPGNSLIGDRNLLASSIALDAAQSSPVQGTYDGPENAFDRMSVDVSTECRPFVPDWSPLQMDLPRAA